MKGFEEPIDAKFDVLEGREYIVDVPADQLPSAQAAAECSVWICSRRAMPWRLLKPQVPSSMPDDSVQKAEDMLQRAEDYYQRKQGARPSAPQPGARRRWPKMRAC